ncbi:hypothetical protein ZHAS_00018559 [Anopheles sinensis]|uniref:Uncharacterized protein n=1 Tax=Anopheles sinensis TaxID=74873 RepID=A0A084WJX5_ANOSI|nr:hypothetical protein ZHAS_00018559 [Anopheles sinensis]
MLVCASSAATERKTVPPIVSAAPRANDKLSRSVPYLGRARSADTHRSPPAEVLGHRCPVLSTTSTTTPCMSSPPFVAWSNARKSPPAYGDWRVKIALQPNERNVEPNVGGYCLRFVRPTDRFRSVSRREFRSLSFAPTQPTAKLIPEPQQCGSSIGGGFASFSTARFPGHS